MPNGPCLTASGSLLADRGGLDKALARTESGQTYDDELWQASPRTWAAPGC